MDKDTKVPMEGQRAFRQECPQCKRRPYNVEVECRIGPDYLKFEHTTPECGYTFEIPRRDLKTFEGLTYVEIWDKWLMGRKMVDNTPITFDDAIYRIREKLTEIQGLLGILVGTRKDT